MSGTDAIAFIGLGVMGEPMCRNLAARAGRPVVAHDLRKEPLARVAALGVRVVTSLKEAVAEADTIILSLPGEPEVRAVCLGRDGILAHARTGQTVVDTSTVPPALARELAARFAEKNVAFADAPIARTRQAAADGTLSIMVGASDELFARLKPLLALMGSEISHCGPVGAGQVVKLLNNMVLFETVNAVCEALVIGTRAGLDGRLLLETLSRGSADSFALRNHGLKSALPNAYPTDAFSVRYALKDLSYALDLARDTGVNARGALLLRQLFEEAVAAGHGNAYHPVIRKVIEGA
ncbi:MAG: NAD(P)-dependent oxidoreductase [Alphaproteobacteria bacterium]|nr:NAD(P)-dependent oxidoreductase [Alphaproteobacteria bacterium]